MIQYKKILMTLALLLTAVTGAWAQSTFGVVEFEVPADWKTDNTPLTAVDLPGFNAVTLDEAQTWTGAPAQGRAMLVYAFDGNTIYFVNYNNGNGGGATTSNTKQQVFALKSLYKFYYTTELTEWPLTPDADKKVWTLAKMPANNIELQVEYYPGMLTLPASLTGGTLSVVGMTAPFTKLEVLDAWKDDNTLLSAAHLPGLKEMTDAEAQNWTGSSGDYVILIYGFDGTKAKTATYFGGEFFNASPEEVTLSQLKTASADAELYYSSEAQMPAGFEKDEEGNIYVEPGTEFQVKVVPNEDYHLVSLTDGTNDIEVDADGIATITMPDEYADLTLTATFAENTYAVTFADDLAEPDKWTASPNTGVTKGDKVTVTYTGTKKVLGVKAEKKAAAAAVPEYYNKLTKINDNFMDQVNLLKQLGRGYQAYNSSLTAAQAYALATYQAAIDGKPVYVIMSSQDEGYEIHYAVSTDASATEHTADLYNLCSESNTVRMYYVAQ